MNKIYSGQCFLSYVGTKTTLVDYLGLPIYSGDLVRVIQKKYEYFDNDSPSEQRFKDRSDQSLSVVLSGHYDATGTSILIEQVDWVFGYGTMTDYPRECLLQVVVPFGEVESGTKITNYRFE